ncbi:MAG: MerR family transcriptional regulator [Kouleothrix sp.]|nr:MerR family transcriptional regulator [Kouleothrix sp.]
MSAIEQLQQILNLSDTPHYNIKAVVCQTQIPLSTLRAWEQRYGVPQPHRSEQGHRRYSARDVALIRWLRQCTEDGLTISHAIALMQEAMSGGPVRLETRPGPAAATRPPVSAMDQWQEARERILGALAALDVYRAHLLVNALSTIHPLETLLLELFHPLALEIGQRWASGRISVADGHLAISFIRQRLLALLQLHAPFAHGPRLICTCVPGEQHELGLLMFALLMIEHGWEVVYLGQDLALPGLDAFLTRLAPAVVSLSCSLIENVPAMHEVCQAVGALEHHGLVLTYSGRIFAEYPELQQRLPGLYLGLDLRAAVDQVLRYTSRTSAGDPRAGTLLPRMPWRLKELDPAPQAGRLRPLGDLRLPDPLF